MITSAIGKLFLEAYNDRHGTDFDAERFFMEVYFPLFFGHGKYLMSAGNNPLENPKISWGKMYNGEIPYEDEAQRKQRLDRLMENVRNGGPSTDNAIGFASNDHLSTTAGQTTNINFGMTQDDTLCSWFGASLGVMVKGPYLLLFTNKQILLDIFDGWQHYRNMIDHTTIQKGNQVNAWNSQWLVHRYGRNYDDCHPLDGLNITSVDKGIISVDTTSWTQVLIGISRHFKSDVQMIGYVYYLDKTNTTIGFLPFYLQHIRKPLELYQQQFGAEEGRKAEALWGTAQGLKACCQRGAIGIRAMKPKALKGTRDKGGKLRCDFSNEEQRLNFNTYKIWLMAMLNNEDMWKKSEDFAHALQIYLSNSEKRLNTARTNKVETLLTSHGKRTFIAAATEMMDDPQLAESLRELVHLVHTMPDDNVPYFITLIRFNKLALDQKQ